MKAVSKPVIIPSLGGEKVVSEKKRVSNARWDSANLKAISTKVRKDVGEEFQRICEANGESMHSVLKRFVEQYIEDHKK